MWLIALIGLMTARSSLATPSLDPVPPVLQSNYDVAHGNYLAHPDDDRAAWELGRACFDRAEFARSSAERARLANEGGAACRKVVAHQPNLAVGHYYLALNLAQLARTKFLAALPIVNQMSSEWKIAQALDQTLDFGGPDRYGGLLYRDAPGWPISVGDNAKARKHLLRAVEIRPDFPENLLNLIETYLMWNEVPAAAKATDELLKIWPKAQKEFTGDYWAPSWKDWNQRLQAIQSKLQNPSSGLPATKP